MSEASAASLSFAQGDEIALVSEEPRTLGERIAERVRGKPDGVIRSYREDGRHQARTYAWLWRQAGDVAAALCAAGVLPATPVVILTDDILDFAPSFWGCLRAAAIPVALMSVAKDAVHRNDPAFGEALTLLERPVFLVDDYFEGLIARLPLSLGRRVVRLSTVAPVLDWVDRAPASDTAYLVATSGSTGRLKLVELSQSASIYRNYARGQIREPNSPEPPAANTLGLFPLDTVTGQHGCFLHRDAVTQISSHALTVRPTAILDAIEAFDITTLSLTSSMINRLLAAEQGAARVWRLGSLRAVGLGAEPISAGLVQAFWAMLKRHGAAQAVVTAGYGTTETGTLVAGSSALLTSSKDQPVCLGRPWHGVAMRIVGDDGAVLPAGEVGALEVSCPAKMFTRYWGDARLTAESFTADGWWKTGDLGQLIDGQITLRGRSKEVLIQNARKLSLADIDAEIQAVLGVGAAAHAYVVVDPATQAEALGVAFDAGGAMAEAKAAEAIRTAIVRRFGVQPQRIDAIPADAMPRTAAGKVRRAALGPIVVDLAGKPVTPVAHEAACEDGRAPVASRLESIWREVLGLERVVRPDDHFFDLGGDSLRALTLHLQITEAFGVRIANEAFFADPTFRNLLQLVNAYRAGMADAPARQDAPWPLPAVLRQGLASALGHWPGERSTPDATIVGFNLDGERPPIFWVFNVPAEPVALARALGSRQPLYAMRSGYNLSDYAEDEIQAFALRYVSEIERLRPTGPLFIGGNCQGAVIALAVAQHLLRRKRHVPLLVLMDWSFDLQAYQGRVLFVSGAKNQNHNPHLAFAKPELAWSRAFAHHAFAEITGGYAQGFERKHVRGLVETLADHMQSALAAPPVLTPDSGYRVNITVQTALQEMKAGEVRSISVLVANESDIVWAKTVGSGIVLGSRWFRDGQPLQQPPQPRAEIPELRPLETAMIALEIVAPTKPGALTLVIDLVEEGNRWFGGGLILPVHVSRDGQWRRFLRK